jgi:hypothetical protein
MLSSVAFAISIALISRTRHGGELVRWPTPMANGLAYADTDGPWPTVGQNV